MTEANDLITCISNHKPFSITFKHFAIDAHGQILLLGYVEDNKKRTGSDSPKVLSNLRDDLLKLSKIEFKHFEAQRPKTIG